MSEKSREKSQHRLESSQSSNRDEEPKLTPRTKPHWPSGLQPSAKKDMTCFIPEHLAVVLSQEAFEQLFAYAYSTTSEVCCLGTVKQEGERFRVERFYLVGQTGSSGMTCPHVLFSA